MTGTIAKRRRPVEREDPKEIWEQTGLRMHPELRRVLRAKAALQGVPGEEFLHEVLCRELDRRDLSLRGRTRNNPA